MKKIYLVSSGSYSDYHIDAVFDDQGLAQSFIDSFKKDCFGDKMNIEEWELNAGEYRKGLKPYFIRFKKKSSDIDEINIEESSYGFSRGEQMGRDIEGGIYAHVWGKDEKHAIKVANEKRAQFLAQYPQ